MACSSPLNIGTRVLAVLGTVVLVTIALTTTTLRAAGQETVIHDFAGQPTDGAYPYAGLVLGPDGALYGTTVNGGAFTSGTDSGYGTVFQLTRSGNGWSETVIHNFQDNPDGAHPYDGLIFGPDGALYGTTAGGGDFYVGTVFKLTRSGTGWSETVLHSFSGPDGFYPYGGLIFGHDGALYGTTYYGGATYGASVGPCAPNGCGTVFELTPIGTGGFEIVLHSFSGPDGANPYAGVTLGPDGRLYGTTYDGGSSNDGTVFRLSPQGGTYTLLHSFAGPDGANPYAGVIFGPDGALYGTTYYGGAYGDGTVFRVTLTPPAGGAETVVHSFQNSPDGANPYGGLILGRDSALYGTTYDGGGVGAGTVFKIGPPFGMNRPDTVLYSFQGNPDGAYPAAGVIFGSDGALYGTTAYGGVDYGTVFELAP